MTEARPRLNAAAMWAVILFFTGYLLVVGQALLVPFVLALFLWYLVNTLAGMFGGVRIAGIAPPRWLQYLLSGAVLLVGVQVAVNIVTNSVGELIAAAPEYQGNLQQVMATLQDRIDFVDIPDMPQLVAEYNFAGLIRVIATSFGGLVGNAGLVAVYLLFLFLEQRYFSVKLNAVLATPARQRRVWGVLSQIDEDVRTYLGVKTLISLGTALASWAIMAWVGLDFAGFWALLIFVLNFIPNIGSLIATALPTLLALVQFDSLGPFLVVLLGVGAIQLIMGNVVDPSLMGKSLNMSPLAIILSLVVWGFMWGIPGMFLCVPIMVIGMIVLYNFEGTRWLALLLSQNGRLRERPSAVQASQVASAKNENVE